MDTQRIQRIGINAFIMTIALLSVYFISAPMLETPQERALPLVDIYMLGPTIKRFSAQGELLDMTYSKRWDHYIENDQILIEEPMVQMYAKDGTTWRISAQKGKGQLSPVGKLEGLIDLNEDVKILRLNHEDIEWELNTDHLALDPIKKQSHTDSKVSIIGPSTQIEAMGLKADLLNKHIKLLTDVKTTYVKSKT